MVIIQCLFVWYGVWSSKENNECDWHTTSRRLCFSVCVWQLNNGRALTLDPTPYPYPWLEGCRYISLWDVDG
ncbi:hypothetical protein ACOMHN_028154 [Nucella lapillus]